MNAVECDYKARKFAPHQGFPRRCRVFRTCHSFSRFVSIEPGGT